MRYLLLFLMLLSSTAYAQYWIQDAPFTGEKAIKFQDSFYHWDSGQWMKLETDQVGTQYPSKSSFHLQWQGFLKEATLILTLAQENLQHANPEYLELFQQTQSKVDFYLHGSPIQQDIVQKALGSMAAKLKYSRADKINSIKLAYGHLQELWPKNERTKKFWNKTLVVPLSVEWFRSHPELSRFFDQVWINSGYDIRIRGGLSGEGVSIDKSNLGNPDDSYTQMKLLFSKTFNFVSELPTNHPVKKTPEWSWLVNYDDQITNDYFQRFIFIHEGTWEQMERNPTYADFVMVNQRISFISSFPFLSLLLHELNVNSGEFALLPRDTHLPDSLTVELLRRKELPKSLTEVSQILRIQPELSLIQLNSFFRTLEEFEQH